MRTRSSDLALIEATGAREQAARSEGDISPAQPLQAVVVLAASTLAFTVCFMVWMMFGVIGIPIKKALDLNATQFGILTATPVLTGSLVRVPLGMWTDKYGGRVVMFVLMLACVPALWLIPYATAFWQFLVLGLFLGLAGGSFSVGTPYVARWFGKKRQGLAMGVYGAGNSGAAVNKFIAPAIVVAAGWALVPQVYAIAMLATAIVFWLFTYSVSGARRRLEDELARAARCAEGPAGVEVLPVLLHRVRRLCRIGDASTKR